MQKKLIILFISFLNFTVNAQDLKLNLLGLASKKIELSAEFGGDRFSLEPMIGYSFKDWASGVEINGEDISVKRQGILGGLRANWYFKPKERLDGFYLSPYSTFYSAKIIFDTPTRQTRLSTGLILGRKGFFSDNWGYLVEAGLGYSPIYKYKEISSGNVVELEEQIFGGLTKINIPFRISLVYRIGGN